MKQTKNILNQLESRYSGIDYYYVLVEKIEENVNSHPDIAIECCKALLEGVSKFIWKQIDLSYDAKAVDKMDFQPLVKQALKKIGELNADIEEDFVNKLNKIVVCIGELRNKRGDISHGKLAPKSHLSDTHFSNLVVNITDNMLYYILYCFSKVSLIKELEYEDYTDFNEKIDSENPLGFLKYSKALFAQDIEDYKQQLLDYLDTLAAEEE